MPPVLAALPVMRLGPPPSPIHDAHHHPTYTHPPSTPLANHLHTPQVQVSYDEGIYAWLFSSIPDEEVKPEWERMAQEAKRTARRSAVRTDPTTRPGGFPWPGKPVRAHITGGLMHARASAGEAPTR